ncbi:MAG: ABC transporter substrate-binding protein, partial [Pseudorhodoferax sp.]
GNAYPSAEVVAATGTDFAYGRLSAFRDKDGVATPERLAQLGIKSYIVQGTLVKGTAETMDDVYADIANIGKIFDVQPKADALVSAMKTDIDAVHAKVATVAQPVKVLVYDSNDGDKTIYTAGKALETALIALAGGQNIFADLPDTWDDVNFEDTVTRAPDVIVINDYSGDSADKKIADIKGDPALATIPAVKNNRFVVLPLTDVFEGVRNPTAVKELAAGFYPDLFK